MVKLFLILTLCGEPEIAIIPEMYNVQNTVHLNSTPYLIPEEYKEKILYLMKMRKLRSFEIQKGCTAA